MKLNWIESGALLVLKELRNAGMSFKNCAKEIETIFGAKFTVARLSQIITKDKKTNVSN